MRTSECTRESFALAADVFCERGQTQIKALVRVELGIYFVSLRQTHLIQDRFGPIREFRLLNGQRLIGFGDQSSGRRLMIEE